MRTILLLLLTISFFALQSCTRGDVISQEEDLIGTWQVYDIRSDRPYDWDGDGFSETDIFGNYSYCQQDIFLVFEPGGYGEARQGCNAPWQSMYWQLMGNRLQISLPGDDLDLDLVQFSPSTIRGQDYVYVNGQNFTITYTLMRR